MVPIWTPCRLYVSAFPVTRVGCHVVLLRKPDQDAQPTNRLPRLGSNTCLEFRCPQFSVIIDRACMQFAVKGHAEKLHHASEIFQSSRRSHCPLDAGFERYQLSKRSHIKGMSQFSTWHQYLSRPFCSQTYFCLSLSFDSIFNSCLILHFVLSAFIAYILD